jgi:hypothetical protein
MDTCRQKMIEKWEAQEWNEREGEILGVQEERLALLDQAIQVGGQYMLHGQAVTGQAPPGQVECLWISMHAHSLILYRLRAQDELNVV